PASRDALDPYDLDGRVQGLSPGRRRLDGPDHLHALDHAAEGGESLAVRVALAAEVQLRLVADAQEEVRGGGVRAGAVQGDGAGLVRQPGVALPLQLDRREPVPGPARVDAGLDDRYLHLVAGLVVGPHRAVEAAAVVELAVHVAQEVGGRGRRPGR